MNNYFIKIYNYVMIKFQKDFGKECFKIATHLNYLFIIYSMINNK